MLKAPALRGRARSAPVASGLQDAACRVPPPVSPRRRSGASPWATAPWSTLGLLQLGGNAPRSWGDPGSHPPGRHDSLSTLRSSPELLGTRADFSRLSLPDGVRAGVLQ